MSELRGAGLDLEGVRHVLAGQALVGTDLSAAQGIQGPKGSRAPRNPEPHPGLRSSLPSSCSLCLPGVSSEFIVNTQNAGSGALSVTIDGPSKVQLDCRECPEGHVVTYTPMAPGNYLIAIKYGGPQHIVGSPFKAKVTGEYPGWRRVT